MALPPIRPYPFASPATMAQLAPEAVRMINAGDVSGLKGLLDSYQLSDMLPEQAIAHAALGYSVGQWFASDPKPIDDEKLKEAINGVSPFEGIREEWGGAFRPDNPIHDLLSLESGSRPLKSYRTPTRS